MTSRCVLAAVLAAGLTACSGGGGRSIPPLGSPANPSTGTPVTAALRLVGVGDSLTAGEQSAGLMGADVNPNPYYTGTAAGSPYPFVQATQPHGFWALLWAQANAHGNPSAVEVPATSPLPLIKPPGIGQVLVPLDSAGDLTSITTACGSNNGLAYAYTTALQTRLNPTTLPFDVAIPGQTVHEALYEVAPQTPCGVPANAGPLGGLANLVNSEAVDFYPVLGNFPKGTTQISAAAGLHGTIATVWLGSNDLLKYAFSEGALPPADPAALQTDMVAIIRALQGSGAKVAVANLFDVIDAAYFIPQRALPTVFSARLTPVLGAAAAAVAGPQLAGEVDQMNGLGAGGYLTIGGLGTVLGAAAKGQTPPKLGPGEVLPDAVAANVVAFNAAYNAAIGTAVTQTGAVLVDVHAQVAAAEKAVHMGHPLVPGTNCCGFGYGQGFFSLDGLHPSNTGYALLANAFIATLDAKFGTAIPLVNIAAVYATDIYAPVSFAPAPAALLHGQRGVVGRDSHSAASLHPSLNAW